MRRAWIEAVTAVGAWLGVSTLASALVLMLDQPAPTPGGLAFSGILALRASALGSAWIALPHALRLGLARRLNERRTGLLAAVAFVLTCLPIIADQAALMSAGEGVDALATWLEPAMFAALALALGGLFGCHLWLTSGRPRGRGLAVVLVGGAFAVAGMRAALPAVLRSYGPFANLVAAACWLLGASLAYRAVQARARVLGFGALAVALPLSLFAGAQPLARARVAALSAHGLATHAVILTSHKTAELATELPLRSARGGTCERAARTLRRPVAAERARHVLLIGIDALRRDAVGKRIGGRPVTPSLSAFARRGVFHTRAVTPSPATLFALGGVLTGRSVAQLSLSPRIPPNLFSLLGDAFEERFAIFPMGKTFHFAEFRALLTQNAEVEHIDGADLVTRRLIERLSAARRAGKRILALAHYMGPHQPYQGHDAFDFGATRRGRYFSDVAFTDSELGKLFAFLEREGFFEDSLIIVYADHGESLGDPSFYGHGVLPHARVGDVPLIVHHPGVVPRVSKTVVSLLDVAPSVLQFAGRPVPAALRGASLFGGGERGPPARLTEVPGLSTKKLASVLRAPPTTFPALLERQAWLLDPRHQRFDSQIAVVTDRQRLIVNRTSGLVELYDREQDPHERHNRALERPTETQLLRLTLQTLLEGEARAAVCQLGESETHPYDFARFVAEEAEFRRKRARRKKK